MGQRRRPGPISDQAVLGSLYTIATSEWTRPQGQARAELLNRLDEVAGDRPDLLAQAAGLLLGGRPPDEHDPRWTQRTLGAELLLELAGLDEDAPDVQRWIPVGAERRARRPEPPRR